MRVSRQSPENTKFFHATSTELGQGKEDAELQEAERGSSGAGRRLSQENDRMSPLRGYSRQCLSPGLGGTHSKVLSNWWGNSMSHHFPNSLGGTLLLLWNFTLKHKLKEKGSSGSQKCPLKVLSVSLAFWKCSFVSESVCCYRFGQDG